MKKDSAAVIAVVVALISGFFLLLDTYFEHKLEQPTPTLIPATTSLTLSGTPVPAQSQQKTKQLGAVPALQVISIFADIGKIILWSIIAISTIVITVILWRQKILQALFIVIVITAIFASVGTYLTSLVNKPLLGAIIGGILGGALGSYFGYNWWKNNKRAARHILKL